ncbi:hypothetical protein [Nocardia sp. A7]|uniref:hypothetical protein n=1 Tax=Nocardia sp. A7 TaxID=2789274 RepID=UPI00397C5463
MSYVTNFLLYAPIDDEGTAGFLAAVGALPGGVVPARVDDAAFPGSKGFEGEVYAAAGNRWHLDELQSMLDQAEWEVPHQVAVICCTEDEPIEVYRPSKGT